MRSIALYKHINVGNILRFIISLCYDSVKWIKCWQIHIGMVAFNKFLWVYVFAARKKWCNLSGWKIDVTSIIRARIKSEEIKLSCQKFFTVMIFQKRRSFPVVLFIPEGFLALILCQFWHETPYSLSYQRDQALSDSFKVPHQVVDAVNDTVWARELANLFTKKCLFTSLMG